MGSSKGKSKRKAALRRRMKQFSGRNEAVVAGSREDAWSLKPKPVPDEPVHDTAVFARSSREQLSADLQLQANAVADALDLVRQGEDTRAVTLLKDIPRGSPFADWRLFIRGLVACYAGDIATARQAWERLDPTRRPGRMAATLLRAEAGELLFADTSAHAPPGKLVEAARQLRRREQVLADARKIAAVKPQEADLVFSVAQAQQLKAFRDDYRAVDPDFVNRFAQACVRLSTHQGDEDVFDILRRAVPGPAIDPHWNIEAFKYSMQFEGAEEWVANEVNRFIQQGSTKTDTPEPLRQALASAMRTVQASQLVETQSIVGPFGFSSRGSADDTVVEKLLQEAIKLYPSNREAHDELLGVLEQQLDRTRTAAEKKKVEQRIVAAKAATVAAFPSDVELTLWLIDHYFDEGKLPEANELVEQLSDYRLEDPRAKALPWKLSLRQAMHCSRRKDQLPQAHAALDAAEKLWPSWVRRDWLPFLRAALALRADDYDRFAQLDAEARKACGASALLGDFMTFAALQQMNLPSGTLKPFREIVDRHQVEAAQIPLEELLAVGDFWWDLTRTGLRHKAYRLQAAKIGKPLVRRLEKTDTALTAAPHFEGACCWMTNHNFWGPANDIKPPAWLESRLSAHPRIASEFLKALLGGRYGRFQLRRHTSLIEPVQLAAKQETDPFYRHAMAHTVDEVAQSLADMPFGSFGWLDRRSSARDELDLLDDFADAMPGEVQPP